MASPSPQVPISAWHTVRDEVGLALSELDPAAMQALADLFGKTPQRWFATGQGRSGLVARMAAMRLMHAGHPVHVVGDASTPAIGKRDALLAVSATGETKVTLHIAERARESGAHVTAICGRPHCTLDEVSDFTLHLRLPPSEQFGGSLFEQVALLAIDSAILALIRAEPSLADRMNARHANLQ